MKSLLILPIFLLTTFTALPAQSGASVDWDYEIDLLAKELADRHPDLFFNSDSVRFFQAMREVADQSSGKSVFQVAVRLQQVLSSLGDPQTMVNYHFLIEKSKILPVECYWFEDGLYILKTDRMYEPLLGKRLTAFNKVPVERIIDSLTTLLVPDNQSVLKNSIPRMLTWFQLLEYFGFASGNSIEVTALSSSGMEVDVEIGLPVELGEMVDAEPATMPLGWQDQKTFFRDRYFEEENLYYIQYNRCWSREAEEEFGSGASALFMPSFKEFEKQVFPVLRKEKIEKLVFDLRFNMGGNATQGTEFIRKICRTLSKDHVDIFVLVGRATCEEAIVNAVDFMNCAEVALVGEETCGTPNFFGEVNRFVLPESRLIVSHPTVLVTLMPEDLPALIPDHPAPMTFEQYMLGIDPAMEVVRNMSGP